MKNIITEFVLLAVSLSCFSGFQGKSTNPKVGSNNNYCTFVWFTVHCESTLQNKRICEDKTLTARPGKFSFYHK